MSDSDEEEALLARPGLPEDLTFLLEKYPRATWRQSGGLTAMSRFWLKRHAFFRELATILDKGVTGLNEEQVDAVNFAHWFLPRLDLLLGELEAHHNVEDMHYFPILMAEEPRLKRGFDILDADHHFIHDLLERNGSAGRQFAGALLAGGDGLRFAADSYATESKRLLSGLMRHLDDEEDLIMPMLIDRHEDGKPLM